MRDGSLGLGGCLLVLAMGVVGCGATAAAEVPGGEEVAVVHGAEGRSGTRLTAMAYRAGEAVQFRHFHDELLGFDCEFGVDAVGTPRCFPAAQEQIAYLDAQCREPAIQRHGVQPGDWLVEWDVKVSCPGALEPHDEAFLVGKQVYAASTEGSQDYQLYKRSSGGCVPGGGEAKSLSPVYRLLRKPASELEVGRVESFETAAGLRVDRIFATDGAEANLAVKLADGTACKLQQDGSCLGFAAFQGVADECPGSRSSVGASGAELLDMGPGPLHLQVYELSSAAGSFHVPDGYVGQFLTVNGTTCEVTPAADGSLRCVDEQDDVHRSGFYADAGCEAPFFAPNDTSIDDVDDPGLARLHAITRGVGYRVEQLHALSPIQRGATYQYVNGSCEVASAPPSLLLSLSDELGFDALPEVEDARLP